MLHADALFVRRVSVVIVRLLFDLMYVVPAEYAIHVQEQSTTILNTVLARGFGVPLVSLSPLSPSVMPRPSLPASEFAEHAWFVEAQNSVQTQQQEAILRVVGSYLLSFFCPSQQFAAHFIESLHAHAPSWKPSLVQVLRERPEGLFVAFHAATDMLIRLRGADAYFLDYDCGICDRSRLLWFVHEREAVFGFVLSYYPDEEELDELQAKMEEVLNYIPVKHLTLCLPDADNLLNPSEEDEEKQWKTVGLAKDMADRIFPV